MTFIWYLYGLFWLTMWVILLAKYTLLVSLSILTII
jgi:hypothetical protein